MCGTFIHVACARHQQVDLPTRAIFQNGRRNETKPDPNRSKHIQTSTMFPPAPVLTRANELFHLPPTRGWQSNAPPQQRSFKPFDHALSMDRGRRRRQRRVADPAVREGSASLVPPCGAPVVPAFRFRCWWVPGGCKIPSEDLRGAEPPKSGHLGVMRAHANQPGHPSHTTPKVCW